MVSQRVRRVVITPLLVLPEAEFLPAGGDTGVEIAFIGGALQPPGWRVGSPRKRQPCKLKLRRAYHQHVADHRGARAAAFTAEQRFLLQQLLDLFDQCQLSTVGV